MCTFIPYVVIACFLFYNVLLEQDPKEVAWLFEILQTKGMRPEMNNNPIEIHDVDAPAHEEFKMAN